MEKLDELLDELFYLDPTYKNELDQLSEKYNCTISCDIEKHNTLQYTYYYEIDFGLKENFFVEIESGINNGTQLNQKEWGVTTKSNQKTIEVLKDIVLDMEFYDKESLLYQKSKALLELNKSKLFELVRQDNYDN